jgi:hypothetical protein
MKYAENDTPYAQSNYYYNDNLPLLMHSMTIRVRKMTGFAGSLPVCSFARRSSSLCETGAGFSEKAVATSAQCGGQRVWSEGQ